MFISLARQLSNIDRHLCHQSNLGNIWVRSTPGLPGRLEAGQRSSAGFVQANLEADHDEGGLLQPAEEGHGGGVLVVGQGEVNPHRPGRPI